MLRFQEFLVEDILKHGLYYHGTSDKFVPAIKKEGLKGGGHGAWEWAQHHGYHLPPPENAVYVTQQRSMALNYSMITSECHGGKPVIITLDLTKHDMSGNPDEDDASDGSYTIPSTVSPQCILAVTPVTAAEMKYWHEEHPDPDDVVGGRGDALLAALMAASADSER
jgi:hypothetical protein